MSGAQVALGTILGMTLRGNSATLLIDAYIMLRKILVDVSIRVVDVVFIQNKVSASTPRPLFG